MAVGLQEDGGSGAGPVPRRRDSGVCVTGEASRRMGSSVFIKVLSKLTGGSSPWTCLLEEVVSFFHNDRNKALSSSTRRMFHTKG